MPSPRWSPTTGDNLDHLGKLKNYPLEALAPYEEFKVGSETYYFAPGGSLHRKAPGAEGGGGGGGSYFFCVHPTDEVWHYYRRTEDS